MTSTNTGIAVWTPLTLVSRSVLMSVIMTFMFEPAKLQMNCANASGTRTFRNPGDGRVPAEVSDNWTAGRVPRIVGIVQPSIEAHCGSDQREVRERLGEVANLVP